jgi:hypothetical protein
MILRRIRYHFSRQDWIAIVLDFVIVVVGIYVGLQVDNWNQSRKEQQEERIYMERMYSDTLLSIEQNRYQRDFMLSHADRAGVVLESLRQCQVDPGSRTDVANGLYHLGKVFRPYFADGTLDELRSTGKLAIIRSTALKQEIERAVRQFEEFDRIWDQMVSRIIPNVVYVDSQLAYMIEEETRGSTEIGWEDVEMDFRSLCQDRRFYNSVAAVRNYTYDAASWVRETTGAIEDLREQILVEAAKLGVTLEEIQ